MEANVYFSLRHLKPFSGFKVYYCFSHNVHSFNLLLRVSFIWTFYDGFYTLSNTFLFFSSSFLRFSVPPPILYVKMIYKHVSFRRPIEKVEGTH